MDDTVKDLVSAQYPRLNFQESYDHSWGAMLEDLNNQTCGGIIVEEATFVLSRMKGVGTCDLVVVSDNLIELASSYIISSRHGYASCHPYLVQTIDAGLQYLSENGNLTRYYSNFQEKYEEEGGCVSDDLTYISTDDSDDESTERALYAHDLSGVFLLHGLIMVSCSLIRCVENRRGVQKAVKEIEKSKGFRFVMNKLHKAEEMLEDTLAGPEGKEQHLDRHSGASSRLQGQEYLRPEKTMRDSDPDTPWRITRKKKRKMCFEEGAGI
uniref:Uncharacterized protein n=1 Tax=Heterosigma akashiwo TaxID=2829 RepID=A0A7S3XIR6_HETAK